MTPDGSQALFNELVEVTGLSTIIARGTIERALKTVNATIATATVEDYVDAMPYIREKLLPFVRSPDAFKRLDGLERRLMMRAGLISARIQLHLGGASSD